MQGAIRSWLMFLGVNIPLREYIIPSLYLYLWNLAFDLTRQKKMMSLRELIDCEIKFRKSDHLKEQSLSLKPACCHRLKEIWLWTHPPVLFPLFVFAVGGRNWWFWDWQDKVQVKKSFVAFFAGIVSFSPLSPLSFANIFLLKISYQSHQQDLWQI